MNLRDRPQNGRRAESLAAQMLEAKGFVIVERNWRRPQGELDLVACDGEICVFIEVRSRTGDEHGSPLESVTPHKRAQVVRTARLYLAEVGPRAAGFRFDVVGVLFRPGRAPELTHIPGAFDTSPY